MPKVKRQETEGAVHSFRSTVDVGGSGSFLRIDAVYQEQAGRLVDIFDEIRIPLWRLIRGEYKEDHDSLECGDITIEVKRNRTFFTLKEHARNREVDGFEYYPTQRWKFLWEQGNIRLIQ